MTCPEQACRLGVWQSSLRKPKGIVRDWVKMAKTALTREDWIAQALSALAREGHGGVRIEAMARDLGATKGSFYWYFKGLSDFIPQVLDRWEDMETTGVLDALSAEEDPVSRMDIVLSGCAESADISAAIRSWARVDPMVAEIVARVDRRRLTLWGDLLADTDKDTARLPILMHALQLGLDQLAPSLGPAHMTMRKAVLSMVAP